MSSQKLAVPRFLGNVIWLIFGGFFFFLTLSFMGIIFCMTLIGIPFGIQIFKFACLVLCPFGYDAVPGKKFDGILSFVMNVLWLIFFGWETALGFAVTGGLLCITVIGIPFGLQYFKLVKLALFPFGLEIRRIEP